MKELTTMKKRIELIESVDNLLSSIEEDTCKDYAVISETVTDEQKRHWSTGELMWEDEEHTIPMMKVEREYGYVPKKELTEEDNETLQAIADLRKVLLKWVR